MDALVHQASERQGMLYLTRCSKAFLLIYVKGDNWNDLLKEVVTFDSVEEFWGVYVRAPPPPLSPSQDHS